MGTPERSKIGVAPPLSKFEDSPIFNFINNLSPIQPVKSAHGAQVFHSLSFASISSVFASPQINSQKESRFLIKHLCSDSSKLDTSSDNLDERSLCPGISDASNPAVARENCSTICSLNEATVDPPEECSTQPSNLPQSILDDTGSPNHNTTPCYSNKAEVNLVSGQTSVQVAHVVDDGSEKRKLLFAKEIELMKDTTLNKEEIGACDWENLISVDADDLLIFDSSTDSGACNSEANSLTSSQKPVDGSDPYLQNAAQYPPGEFSEQLIEENETDHTPHIFSGPFQNQNLLNDQNHETGKRTDSCFPLDCKVDSQQQRGMRRRCLTFELAGGSTKNSNNNSKLHPSVLLPSSRKFALDNKISILSKPGSNSSPRVLPGIGLHLNTLATTSDRMVTKETLAFGKRFISMPCSISPFPPITAVQKSVNKSLDVIKDEHPTGSGVLGLEVTHDDASEAPADGENLTQGSPKKKKRKSENGGESESCKRCNCKKSKCLKLYCECFAAGIYCVEPCSCQGCFNKPIHEETVLATRKQIESRNPLAFAPKVIRASKPVQDMAEETNKTPASARHKRGCNCKKSSCLKKYCECFQGGVGCSASCRCEGCKNAFGRKDGDEADHAEDIMDVSEKQQDKLQDDQQNDIAQKNEHYSPESILPITPSFETCRPFVKPPFPSSGKPPRSSALSVCYPTSQTLRRCEFPSKQKTADHFNSLANDDTPEILRCDASPNNSVKTISPNGKRVSPPHGALGITPNRKGGRKLILKSIPSFPSLNGDMSNEHPTSYSSDPLSQSVLN